LKKATRIPSPIEHFCHGFLVFLMRLRSAARYSAYYGYGSMSCGL
jgi:hypothetical protein